MTSALDTPNQAMENPSREFSTFFVLHPGFGPRVKPSCLRQHASERGFEPGTGRPDDERYSKDSGCSSLHRLTHSLLWVQEASTWGELDQI
jgi:hypothetical protein